MNLQLGACDCPAECFGCGVKSGLFPSWCGVVTSSACPTTMAVSFEIPEREVWYNCSGTETVLITFPSWSGTITVDRSEINNCGYSGTIDLTVSVPAYDCAGNVHHTYIKRTVTVSIESAGFSNFAFICSPCCEDEICCDPSPSEPCNGIIVGINSTFYDTVSPPHGETSWQQWQLSYKAKNLASCTDEVECHTQFGGAAKLYNTNLPEGHEITTCTIT